MYQKQPTSAVEKVVDKTAAIPMPTPRKIRQIKGLLEDMMMVLAPTVFSEAEIGADDPKVVTLHDVYYALEDALQGLEEI